MKTLKKSKIVSIIALLIALSSFLIYYPGLNGPFIFDDFDNIVNNKSLHIQKLSLNAVQKAANSLTAGTLGRPIAALSFAFNYYLSKGVNNPFGFKLFNIIIHSINGLLIFWLATLIFIRLKKHPSQPLKHFSESQCIILLAGSSALLWVVHPIQLTSVLYIVQRMTSMAAMFLLLALICYLHGRTAFLLGQQRKGILWLSGLPVFGFMAIFCKETGLLLPLYIAVLELILFSESAPWNRWSVLTRKTRWGIITTTGIVTISIIISTVLYSMHFYSIRDFSMIERLLTEARVLVFYIGQFFVPRFSAFGLYHDDFIISRSLLEPWSTLPAIVIVFSLPSYALIARRSQPLLSLGILWFFVSHLLESTLLPLELVHEHRNYLAIFGLIFVLMHFLIKINSIYKNNKIWLLIPALTLLFSFTTITRSNQWTDTLTLMQAQTQHHPASPRAWMDLANIQATNQQYEKAVSSTRKAILLNSQEPAYSVYLYLYANLGNLYLSTEEKNNILKAIRTNPQNVMLSNLFHKINQCINSSCKDLQTIYETWLRATLETVSSARFDYYLGNSLAAQGKLEEGLKYINRSIRQAPNHLSPYIGKIDVLLRQGRINEAKSTYNRLTAISKKLYGILTNEALKTGKRISEFKPQSSYYPQGLPEHKV